ncbi:glycolipid transfer protein [Serendipita vermifera]|nr:glycolipid transfer protein [Serendipita vermifera]
MATEEKTFFDTLSMSFANVSKEPGVNTAEFLEASRGLVTMFNLLGSTAFAPVISDLNGNIAKIQARLDKDPVNSATLEGLLAEEAKGTDKTATQGLMWLLRGLEFTLKGLQHTYDNPTTALSTSFRESYKVTLSQYHSWVVKPVFSMAMAACPKREDFFKQLGGPPEKVQEQGKAWLDGLQQIVDHMNSLYTAQSYGKGL